MPMIRSQKCDATGITIVASNGKAITLTKAQIAAQYAKTTGTLAARKAATNAWVQQQIETGLGKEMVPQSSIAYDFDPATGAPLTLKITG